MARIVNEDQKVLHRSFMHFEARPILRPRRFITQPRVTPWENSDHETLP